MKKLIVIAMVALSTSVYADPYRGHYEHGGGGWVAPLIIGGALGYMISRPQPAVQPPVVITPAPAPIIMQGPVPIYQEVVQYDNECGCYIKTYRQIGWK